MSISRECSRLLDKQGQSYWYGVRMISLVPVYLMWAVFSGHNVNLKAVHATNIVIILCLINHLSDHLVVKGWATLTHFV